MVTDHWVVKAIRAGHIALQFHLPMYNCVSVGGNMILCLEDKMPMGPENSLLGQTNTVQSHYGEHHSGQHHKVTTVVGH